MCGIAGIHFKRPGSLAGSQLDRLVSAMLLGIEHRGEDATGVVAVGPEGKRVLLSKEAMPARDFVKVRPSLGNEPVRTVMMHTRFATQGRPENNANNHPVLHGTTFAIHNGHISNDDGLFESNDIKRIAEVDSEIIPALFSQGGFENAKEVLEVLTGGFAIGVIDPVEYPDELILAKGSTSPLIFIEKHDFIIWASTLDTIRNAWSWVLGTPPAKDKFRELKSGQVLHFKGADRELSEFEVNYPVYTGNTYYQGSGQGSCSTGWSGTGGYTSRSTKPNTSILCECGHTRFWHRGLNYDMGCMVTKDEELDGMCSCREFAMNVAVYEAGDEYLRCDGCNEWAILADCESFGSYYLCDDCMGTPATATVEQTAATIASLVEDTGGGMSLVPFDQDNDPTTVVEKGEWAPLVGEEQKERHEYLLDKTAEATGYDTTFVEWILFRAPMETLEADNWLSGAREECDSGYAEAEEELRAWEDEAGTTLNYVNDEGILVMH